MPFISFGTLFQFSMIVPYRMILVPLISLVLFFSKCPYCNGQSNINNPYSPNNPIVVQPGSPVVVQPANPLMVQQANPVVVQPVNPVVVQNSPPAVVPVAQVSYPCANMPPPRFDDKKIQEFDKQLTNLRAAIELFQSYRAAYTNLPNCHWNIQDLYAIFQPILAAADQVNLNGINAGTTTGTTTGAGIHIPGTFGISGGLNLGLGANAGLGIGAGIGLGR